MEKGGPTAKLIENERMKLTWRKILPTLPMGIHRARDEWQQGTKQIRAGGSTQRGSEGLARGSPPSESRAAHRWVIRRPDCRKMIVPYNLSRKGGGSVKKT